MKTIRTNILIAIVLGFAIVHAAAVCRAQAFLSDQVINDPHAAGMGGASLTQLGSTATTPFNPASAVKRPGLWGSQSYIDLRDFGESDSRVESTVVGMGLGDAFGIGVKRTQVFFDRPESEKHAAVDRHFEKTDAVFAGLDLARMMLPEATFLTVAFGADYKFMERSAGPMAGTNTDDRVQDIDYGGLAELRLTLQGDPEGGEPRSYLALRGGFEIENARRNLLERGDRTLREESGFAENTGVGAALVLGSRGPYRHALRVEVSIESRRFEQVRPVDAAPQFAMTESVTDRYGVEIALADVLFGRAGRVEIGGRPGSFETYGLGLMLSASNGAVQLRLDYARTPWLNDELLDLSGNGEAARVDQLSAQVAFGL